MDAGHVYVIMVEAVKRGVNKKKYNRMINA
jgi:hypothetical protein